MNAQTPADIGDNWMSVSYTVNNDNPPLLIAGDRLIVFSAPYLYAINLYTGAALGKHKVEKPNRNDTDAPPIASIGGAVFFPNVTPRQRGKKGRDYVLQALRLVDGQPLAAGAWQQSPPSAKGIQSLLAIRPASGKFANVDLVVIVRQEIVQKKDVTTVSAFRAADASLAWKVSMPPGIGAIAYGDDAVFFVSGQQLFAINASSGDTRFPKPATNGATAPLYNFNQTTAPLVAMAPPPPLAAATTAAANQGVVVCVGDQVWGFDTRTGAQRWVYPPVKGDTFNGNAPVALSDDGALVAVVSDSNTLYVLDAQSGSPTWQQPQPVGYRGTPAIGNDQVFICGSDQQNLVAFDLATGTNKMSYPIAAGIDAGISGVPAAVGNGHLFVQDATGAIHAQPYASQTAAYFDGQATHLKVKPDQFDFGSGDFTIEAWVRSCEGGEILCGYPTDGKPTDAGFRLNLSDQGELRFAVIDLQGANQDLHKGLPTGAADGFWHHIAAVRRNGDVSFFVDGVAASPLSRLVRDQQATHANGYPLLNGRPRRDQLTPTPPPPPVAISGNNKLFIGWDKYGVKAGSATPYHFTGLMREVRLWNAALDATAINSCKRKVLGPKGLQGDTRTKANEPQLLGNWHLDDAYDTDQPVTVENDVLNHEYAATFIGQDSRVTDLELDLSAFPYVLQPLRLQWPYAGVWTTRGEHDIATPAALSANGIVCFGTDNSLYGVRRLDGARQWSLSMPEGNSFPIAAGKSFYVQDGEQGIIAIDALSGVSNQVPAFVNLPRPDETQKHVHRSAPAASGGYLAAAGWDGTNGSVWIAALDGSGTTITFNTGENPGDLQFVGTLVGCVASTDTGLQLFIYDMGPNPQFLSVAVDSPIFTLCGSRAFITQGGQLTVIDTSKQPGDVGYQYFASSVTSAQITGLAAASDANILAVSTNTGQIYGLSMATLMQKWSPVAIPDGPGSVKGVLNAPTIAGQTVFCTSSSGAIAALDAGSGRLLGLFFEPNAVITPALVDAGTAFFGCAPADPTAALDGALHSVVFGDTVALRVNVDPLDQPTSGGYAVIEPNNPLVVLRGEECCVEAWINTTKALDAAGGEILSIRPTSDGNTGLRLYLDGHGRVHFISHVGKGKTWKGIHARTLESTGVRDGQWHHVAASRAGTQDVRIYVDGKQQAVTVTASQDVDAADQLKIHIGAPAYQVHPDVDTSFHGLITDVRLWDAYLPADQISNRMHTKLRGDEFNLVAAWDFSALGVHDLARNGYDGALLPSAGVDSATFWLCDLAFGQPDYPEVTTAVDLHEGEGGQSSTNYTLTITCTKADRSPLAGALLRLWYVAHPDEQQPATITLSTVPPAGSDKLKPPVVAERPDIKPVPADQEGTSDEPGFVLYTDAAGQAVVTVKTLDRDHGPSLDLSADFMPANERFHINVLIDAQALAKAQPPSLIVQTKLIQDYHYSPGDTIDDSHSRNTYRAVITALNADHSPRAGEWLEVSALDYTTIEVAGQSYDVNPHNAQSFQADASGQLIVVVAAQDENTSDAAGLKTPDLSVWAGFMHQGERVTIALDQDTHAAMSTIQGDAMKNKNRRTDAKKPVKNDNRPYTYTDTSARGALLTGGYENHSDDVAAAIRHVASATQPSPPVASANNPSSATASTAPRRPARRATQSSAAAADDRFRAFRQPVRPPYGDLGQALRTQKHVLRRAPVTPESMLASITQASGDPNAVGFYVNFDGGGDAPFAFGHFTAAEADQHMRPPATATMAPPRVGPGTPLGWGLSDLWDDVESAAEEAADEIRKIAIEVSDHVTAAIQYVDGAVTVVITSIADAMEVIGNFIEKLAMLIWEFIQFLLFLFDWAAILATHDILRDTMFSAFHYLIDGGKIGDNMVRAAGEIFKNTPGFGDGLPDPKTAFASDSAQTSPQDRIASAPSRDYSGANGVSGTMIYSKMNQYSPVVASAAGFSQSDLDNDEQLMWTAASNVEQLLPNLASSSPGALGGELLDTLKKAGDGLVAAITGGLGQTIDSVIPTTVSDDDLSIPYHIPFISEIYKWLTGDDLTLLDATCLMLALPVNLVYGVLTRGGEFNEKADGLPALIGNLPSMSQSLGMAERRRVLREGAALSEFAAFAAFDITDQIPWSYETEIAIGVLRVIQGLLATATDAMFALNPQNPEEWRSDLVVINGFLGVASAVLVARSMGPEIVDWLSKEGYSIDKEVNRDLGYAALATGAFPFVFKVIYKIVAANQPGLGDKAEFVALLANGLAICAGLVAALIQTVSLGVKPSEALAAYWMFQISQGLQSMTQVDACLYTQTAARNPSNEGVYEALINEHIELRSASLALQTATAAMLLARK
jgi:outer membrane protein assembly factor BamB